MAKIRPSRRRTPWHPFREPITRLGPTVDAELSEQFVQQHQYARMLKIKKYYGIEGSDWWSWYQLALAIASELDDGLKVTDYKPRAPNWKGVGGYVLVEFVKELQEKNGGSERDALRYLIKNNAFYKKFPLKSLIVRLAEARRHHLPGKKLRTWDGRTITKR